MVIRVGVRLESASGTKLKTAAMANSAFESEEAELIVPERVAEELGLYPLLPTGAEVGDFKGVGGVAKGYRIKGLVKAWVEAEDKKVGPRDVVVSILPGEDEVLLCDKLIDALEIELVRPGEGLWRFKGEAALRKSVPAKRW